MTKNLVRYLMVPAVLVAMACGGKDERAIDEALKQDLWLANRTSPYSPYASPMELGYGQGYAPYGAPYGYPQPQYPGGYQQTVARPAPVIQRVPVASRAPAPVQRTRVVKNTKRDAIIGAVAGGAIGAVTSRDKLKGAVIGAAAGGLLGAIIGNNVDKKRVPVP
jgi:hypothetical protein